MIVRTVYCSLWLGFVLHLQSLFRILEGGGARLKRHQHQQFFASIKSEDFIRQSPGTQSGEVWL